MIYLCKSCGVVWTRTPSATPYVRRGYRFPTWENQRKKAMEKGFKPPKFPPRSKQRRIERVLEVFATRRPCPDCRRESNEAHNSGATEAR